MATREIDGRKEVAASGHHVDPGVAAGLVAAVVGVGVLVVGPTIRTLVDVNGVLTPIVQAVATVAAVVLAHLALRRGWRMLTTVVVSTTVVTVVVAVPLVGLAYHQTDPGRSARGTATRWRLINADSFDAAAPCVSLPADAHGSGQRCYRDATMRLKLIMSGLNSASQEARLTTVAVRGRFYAETATRPEFGSDKVECALLFGMADENHWYAFRLRGATVSLTHFDGQPSRSLLGPSAVESIRPDSWTRLGVLVDGSSATLYVNDREYQEIELDPAPTGLVDLATIMGSTERPYDVTCAFDHFNVYQG
jgi:hypothetical protein